MCNEITNLYPKKTIVIKNHLQSHNISSKRKLNSVDFKYASLASRGGRYL